MKAQFVLSRFDFDIFLEKFETGDGEICNFSHTLELIFVHRNYTRTNSAQRGARSRYVCWGTPQDEAASQP